MLRLLYTLALGLVGAGIVHIAVLFLLPSYSERDAWSRLSAAESPYAMVRLDRDLLAGGATGSSNPFLQAAACRFNLSDGVLRVRAQDSMLLWSMSIYDRNGLNIFSLNDQAASGGAPDIVVANRTQMQLLRAALPEELAQSLFVEVDTEEGIALVRAFVPDDTWQGLADTFLASLECEPRDDV